ncbi:oxygenase MpaB family protein [Streptomyces durmitorensis]|uniref:oxygenase MpaB family protein n=1 Tax=Streptomyces durmitorensis TaxID=319947 RepID=UPI0031D52055
MRWIPSLLWRPFAALSAHYALLVNVGTLPPVLRERLGLTWPPRGRPRRTARTDRGGAGAAAPADRGDRRRCGGSRPCSGGPSRRCRRTTRCS